MMKNAKANEETILKLRREMEKTAVVAATRAAVGKTGNTKEANSKGPEVIQPAAADLRNHGVFILREEIDEVGPGK